MTVDPDEAYRRMISRFLETGRIIGSDFFKGVGTKPRDTYNVLKREGRIAQVVDIDADGPPVILSALQGADPDLAVAILRRPTSNIAPRIRLHRIHPTGATGALFR